MKEAQFVLSHYSAICLLALMSYVFGRALTRRVKYNSVSEQVSFSIALGLGLISYLILFLGLVGLIYPWLVAIALLIGLASCFAFTRGQLLTFKTPGKVWARYWMVAVVAVFIIYLAIPILLQPLYPPTGSPDATSYHLASAKTYVQNHRLVFTPNLRYPVAPQTNQMLFTGALLFYDEILAQLIELLMMVTLAIALVAFGRRFFSAQSGYWAAGLLLASPLVLWLGSVAYIDMGFMFFSFITVYAFWNWLQKQERTWLVLAGVFCGLAIGTKQTGLFFLGSLTIVAAVVSLKKRSYAPPVLYAAIACVVAFPWFARSFYYAHNPIFPLLYSQFGRLFGYGRAQPEFYGDMMQAISTGGISRDSAPVLLWRVATTGYTPPGIYSISCIPFFFLPISLITAIKKTRMRGLLILSGAYVVFWLLTVRDLRFLVPMLPFLAIVTAAAFSQLISWITPLANGRPHAVATAIGLAVLIYPGSAYTAKTVANQGPLPATPEARDAYLTSRLPSYPAFKLLNHQKGSNYAVYVLHDELMAYFADGKFMGDWFGPTIYSRVRDKFFSGQALYGELRELGADSLLLRNNPYGQEPPADEFFRHHFKPIYDSRGVRLFELTDRAFEIGVKNILSNFDFEELTGGRLKGWQLAGSPVVDSSGQYSYSGLVAVRCNHGGDVLYQLVPINGSTSYSLSARAHSVGATGTAKVQVNWWNANGALIHEDLKALEVEGKWAPYDIKFRSPDNAVSATIYISPLDPSSVWFDDISFGEMEYRSLP